MRRTGRARVSGHGIRVAIVVSIAAARSRYFGDENRSWLKHCKRTPANVHRNPTERRCFIVAMPDNPDNYDRPDASRRSPGIDRARLLREATTAFLDTLPGNAMAARQFAVLAEGFLPQIARDDAIAVARMLASRLPLPDIIQSAFRRNGIGFRHQDLFSQHADEEIGRAHV